MFKLAITNKQTNNISFIVFVKKRATLSIFCIIVALSIYLVRLVNHNIGIDTLFVYDGDMTLGNMTNGRWMRVFLTWLWSSNKFNYFLSNFIALILLVLSNFSWLYLIENRLINSNVKYKSINISSYFFSAFYLSSMIFAYNYYFTAVNVEYFLNIFICPFVLDFYFRTEGIKTKILIPSLFLIFMYSIYPPILFMFIAGFLISLLLIGIKDFRTLFIISFIYF